MPNRRAAAAEYHIPSERSTPERLLQFVTNIDRMLHPDEARAIVLSHSRALEPNAFRSVKLGAGYWPVRSLQKSRYHHSARQRWMVMRS